MIDFAYATWCRRGDSNPHRNHAHFVSPYDEADTYVVQHDFLHMSFYKEDFKDFVDCLLVALREMERDEKTAVVPIRLVEAVPVPAERL